MAGFDAPYVRRLRLPRPADRAAGRPRARAEEARDVGGRVLPRLPRVRRAVRRHDERAVPAPRHPRRLGRAVPDDGLPVPGGDRARASARSSSRGSSTRARSRSTGASTAARRSPRPRSSTRITRRRRSTSSSRSRRRAPASSRRACRRSPAATCRCSSGRRRPGRFRRTWRSRFIRSSTTPRTTSTAARSSSPRRWRRRWRQAVGRAVRSRRSRG